MLILFGYGIFNQSFTRTAGHMFSFFSAGHYTALRLLLYTKAFA